MGAKHYHHCCACRLQCAALFVRACGGGAVHTVGIRCCYSPPAVQGRPPLPGPSPACAGDALSEPLCAWWSLHAWLARCMGPLAAGSVVIQLAILPSIGEGLPESVLFCACVRVYVCVSESERGSGRGVMDQGAGGAVPRLTGAGTAAWVRFCCPPAFGRAVTFLRTVMCWDIVQPRAAAAYVAACTKASVPLLRYAGTFSGGRLPVYAYLPAAVVCLQPACVWCGMVCHAWFYMVGV